MQRREIIFIVLMAIQSLGILLLLLYIKQLIKRHRSDLDQKGLWAEEDAMKKIAAELHDNLAPSLLLTKLQLEQYNRTTKSASVSECADRVGATLEQLRELSYSLHPSSLAQLGWREATKDLLQTLEQYSNLKTNFSINSAASGIHPENEIQVYRIIQESIQNILQHAQASEIGIAVHERENFTCIDIRDNGIGFVTPTHRPGSGLHNMRQRAHALNGWLSVESSPGNGTFIHLQIPK